MFASGKTFLVATMDFSSLQNATELDKVALRKVAKIIRKEKAIARAYKHRIDGIALCHQAQISALTKDLRHLQKVSDSAESSVIESKVKETEDNLRRKFNGQIQVLEDELSTVRAELRKVETESNGREQELLLNRQNAAADANIIMQLREEVHQLRETKDRVTTESVEKHARNMQLLRESHESESKVTKYEESNLFLRSEVMRLSQELAETRTIADSSRAAHDAAISAANKANVDLSSDLAKANIRGQQLATQLADVERHVIDLQADFDREKSDQRAEIDSLMKQVEMHREATKDAKIQLAGCTELLGTLAKERKEADRHPSNTCTVVDKHAEVLFKNLNMALDAKLQVLEKERHELSRARATEARMATRQQALVREADTARRELDETRQQMITLEAEVTMQKDKVGELERKLLYATSTGPLQPTSMHPFGDSVRRSFGPNFAASGSDRRRSNETLSPFRHSEGLGSAERALAGMVEIRRRHEALLQGLKDTREEYAELMRD